MASQKGHTDIVGLLLKANANPQSFPKQWYTTNGCSFHKHPKVVQLLLAGEADITLVYSDGISGLICACLSGSLESVELLLNYGADLNQQSRFGLTPLEVAAAYGHQDIVDLIYAVELSQSSSTSPVLTASEIAANVDNETLDD